MNAPKVKFLENARIVWAITAKDLLDALKNKTTLGGILAVVFLVVFYRLMPNLFPVGEVPSLLVYDAGSSSLLPLMENAPSFDASTYPTEERLKHYLANGDVPELGLVIPADFEARLAAGGDLELQGYVMNWVKPSEAAQLQRQFEAKISELLGVPVSIRLDGGIVYRELQSHGNGLTATWAMVFSILLIGISFTPNLMFEEKRTKTLDALLVSPANPALVTISKAITGLFYGLLCFGVAFVLYQFLIVQWGLCILAALCGVSFAISLGLVYGTLLDSQQQLMIWSWVTLLPLFIPLILSMEPGLFPAWVIQVSKWSPSVALADVLMMSFTNQSSLVFWAPRLGWVLLWTGACLGAVAWLLRRAER